VELAIQKSVFGDAGNPLDYPSDRASEPYLVQGSAAHRLIWDWNLPDVRLDDGRSLVDVLAARGAAPLEERVVQVAYGANRNLGNIAWKFRNYRNDPDRDVSADLVALPAYIHDADVVACNIGYWGYVYASLLLHRPPVLDRPYLAGNRVPVTLLLLDEAQMQATHLSEGVPRAAGDERQHVSCDVGVVEVQALGRTLQAQVYGIPLPCMSLDGGALPVAFRRVATESRTDTVPRLDQRDLWAAIVERLHDRLAPVVGDADAEEVVDLIRAGSASRMVGGRGPGDRGQRVYEAVREGIIDRLALIDRDGSPATSSTHLPGLLTHEEAWRPSPLLGAQLDRTHVDKRTTRFHSTVASAPRDNDSVT
jgi:hypothetical protein